MVKERSTSQKPNYKDFLLSFLISDELVVRDVADYYKSAKNIFPCSEVVIQKIETDDSQALVHVKTKSGDSSTLRQVNWDRPGYTPGDYEGYAGAEFHDFRGPMEKQLIRAYLLARMLDVPLIRKY